LNRLTMRLGAISVACFLAALPCSASADVKAFDTPGQTATVTSAAGPTYPCVESVEKLDASMESLTAKDDDGYREAMVGAVMLEPGTRVRFLKEDVDFFKLSGRVRIRVESGTHKHTACWVFSDEVIRGRHVFTDVKG